jgi:integrase
MAEWVQMWRAGVVDLRPSTLAREDGYVERYILPTFGTKKLVDIDHAMVVTWLASMVIAGPVPWWDVTEEPKRARRPLSPATVTKCAQILGKIMTAAVAAGRLKSSPCVGVKTPRIEREEMRFLSLAEITKLADAIDERYRAAVLLSAYGAVCGWASSGASEPVGWTFCGHASTSPRSWSRFRASSTSGRPRRRRAVGPYRSPGSPPTH